MFARTVRRISHSDDRQRLGLRLAWLLIICAVPTAADANWRSDVVWATFRGQYPLHAQVVGITEPSPAGERVLIISEPTPLLPKSGYAAALRAVFGAALKEAALRRQPIGDDGWCEDVVATLSYPTDHDGSARLRDDLTDLAQHLFGTAYKFAPLRLRDDTGWSSGGPVPAKPTGPVSQQAPPDLRVSAAELREWLLEDASSVLSLDTGDARPIRDLLRDGQPGVYLSHERALVMLLVPRDAPLNAMRSSLRKFALDTDAIVGAVAANSKRLMIVGRERDTPTTSVPPLRTETLLALAATGDDELGQSYERNAPFAGKLEGGAQAGKDWAPIYLSEQLYNSEFGSLLNITDQLLKGWSEAGQVHYVRFGYPPPAKDFPFPGGAMASLKAHRLTYNWNTIGVGSITSLPDATIFVLNRTGALPVSYCPGETCTSDRDAAVVAAEETAYRWFAGLRDANLGRVVQYAAIYQIFHTFPVKAERDEAPPANYRAATDVLVNTVRQGFDAIASGQLADRLDARLRKLEAEVASRPAAAREILLREPRKEFAQVRQDVVRAASLLRGIADNCEHGAIDVVARLIADGNGDDDAQCRPSFKFDMAEFRRVATEILPMTGAADQLRTAYMAAAKQIETGYIKTPSVVLSWGDDKGSVGGHNLYSRLTRVRTAPDVPAGQVRIERADGGTVLRINPDDASHASDLSRSFERNVGKADSEVTRALQAELSVSRPVRAPRQAMAIADTPVSQGRGLTVEREGDLALGELGSRPAPRSAEVIARYETEAAQRRLDTLVLHDADGYYVLRFVPKPPGAVRAVSEPAMLEAVGAYAEQVAGLRGLTGVPPVRIGFGPGFSESELRAIQLTHETKTALGGGGGWKPPGPPRPVRSFAPEPERPNGFFFEHEDAPGQGRAGYSAVDEHGDPVSLKLAMKEAERARPIFRKQVNWRDARIRPIDAVPGGGERAGMPQITFEIELDLTSPPLMERAGLFDRRPLVMRVINWFKREPEAAMRQRVHDVIEKSLKSSGESGVLAADGMIRLKSDILRNVGPDALEFHVKYGADDFMMARGRSDGVGSHVAG